MISQNISLNQFSQIRTCGPDLKKMFKKVLISFRAHFQTRVRTFLLRGQSTERVGNRQNC